MKNDYLDENWNRILEMALHPKLKYLNVFPNKINIKTSIPDEYFTRKKIKQIHSWIRNQRWYKNKGLLSKKREKVLNSFGFNWGRGKKESWNTIFNELKNFVEKYGNNYSKKNNINKKLSYWIIVQRRDFKNNKISDDRVKKLKSIGFIFEPHKKNWEENLNKLIKYKNKNGNRCVPVKYRALNTWCAYNRTMYRKGKLSKDRIKKLESIGFKFEYKPRHHIS